MRFEPLPRGMGYLALQLIDRNRSRRYNPSMDDLADYICPTCGESIQIGVDPTAGRDQHYIEDCPVCCNPNAIHVTFDRDGEAYVEASESQ